MWYCTVCGKRNISDEMARVCDKCDMKAEELKAKGEKIDALYCHSCGNKNRSESGVCERCSYDSSQTGITIERGNIKLLVNKMDTLQAGIDRIQNILTEGRTIAPDTDMINARSAGIAKEKEPEKELARSRHAAEDVKPKPEREPCPECNPEGNSSHKGKCRYCDGAGWWPCRKCGGTGIIKDSVLGIFSDSSPKCPKCHGGKWFGCGLCESPAADLGNGKIRPGDGLCRRCHGTGYL